MKILNELIDIVYPPRCHICHGFLRDDQLENRSIFFCRTCSDNFVRIASPICPVCCTPLEMSQEDHLCEDCLRKKPYYTATYACYQYDGAIKDAIHQFKYGSKSFMSKSLGPLLAAFSENSDLMPYRQGNETCRWVQESDHLLIMPVPLHPKRLRERGFNQSLLLADHVAVRLGTELDFMSLRRVKYTAPQTGLGKKARRKNVHRAFEVINSKAVKGKTVLLVDDVATTGNTLNECARILKRSGCSDVFCLVLAKAGQL